MTRPHIHFAECWNCGGYLDWGIWCRDCVRALVLGFMGALGSGVAAYFLARYL